MIGDSNRKRFISGPAGSSDAEQATRPAGDEPQAWWSPSNGYIVPTEPGWPEDAPKRVRVRDRRVLHEMPSDAVHLTPAHVGQRDGGAAGDDTTPRTDAPCQGSCSGCGAEEDEVCAGGCPCVVAGVHDRDGYIEPSTRCDATAFSGHGCTGTVQNGQCSEQDDHHPTAGMTPCCTAGSPCAAAAPRAGADTGMDGVTDDTSAWLMVATGGRSRLAVQGDVGDIREALAEVLERRGAEQ